MKAFRTQPDGAEPSVHAHYLYDASGQRVKKLVRKQGGNFGTTVYIDDLFEHQRWQPNGSDVGENNRLHVMSDQQRIALVRVGPAHPDDRGPAVQYHLGDHLGSSNLIVNEDGSFINREEHTPYGETSFGSFRKKRYRFTGKERDEESGLSYHSARYYAPWLSRWISADKIVATNLYVYGFNSPIILRDSTGLSPETANFGGQAKTIDAFANALHRAFQDFIFDELTNNPGISAQEAGRKADKRMKDFIREHAGFGFDPVARTDQS